jgi:hypothetical protein
MAWEYQELFGAESILQDWANIPTDLRVGQMGYRRRKTQAGPRLEIEIYPAYGREQTKTARRAKSNITPEAMQRYNHERAKRYMIQLADANFTREDISLTLTYAGEPPRYEQAQRDVVNFLNRVKRRRAKRGLSPVKYIYTIEGDEDGRLHRLHIHMLLSGGISREELEELWAKGYANADRLQPSETGLEAITRYMLKQQRHRRRWCASRNLKKPREDKRDAKISNARVKILAYDYPSDAKAIMERLYPNYYFVRQEVCWSDVIDGVYIRVLMRRRE